MSLRRLCSLLFLFLFAVSAQASTPIAPNDLAALIEAGKAPLILDVRTQSEYDAGHVPGAVLIPHDQLEARIGELGAPREVVVYCRSGRRSTLIQPVLEQHGFAVRQLDGSWQAWQAAKQPEEAAKAAPADAPPADAAPAK